MDKKTERFETRLSVRMDQALKNLAEIHKTSKSGVVADLIIKEAKRKKLWR